MNRDIIRLQETLVDGGIEMGDDFKKFKFLLLNTSRTFYLFTCNLGAFPPIFCVKIKIFVCAWKEVRGVCGICVS